MDASRERGSVQGDRVFVREFIDDLSTRTFVFSDDGTFTDWKGSYREFRVAKGLE